MVLEKTLENPLDCKEIQTVNPKGQSLAAVRLARASQLAWEALLARPSKATLWVKAQHEGALPPPCIVRKDPRVPHTCDRLEGPCFLSLSNCSQFTVIYTVSVFSGVTEAEVNDFLKFLVPSRIQ